MRTTLDIEEDVLLAVKERGQREGKTAGKVLSELARQALSNPAAKAGGGGGSSKKKEFFGFQPIPRDPAVIVTNEAIRRLRDEEAI
jgi:hypothetical protein